MYVRLQFEKGLANLSQTWHVYTLIQEDSRMVKTPGKCSRFKSWWG
jgi:hypothetical protein